MSEDEYDEDEYKEDNFFVNKETISIDETIQIHECLIEYTRAMDIPILNSRNAATNLYNLIQK